MEQLAMTGGAPVRNSPFPERRPFGPDDEREVLEALRQQQLFAPKGTKVKEFCRRFSELYEIPYVIPSTSGTAALHAALGALHLEPGDEIITTPISDVGTITPILMLNCIPVFADVDPLTCILQPEAVERQITSRTRAIIVVHCWGQTAPMHAFVELAQKHHLTLIEDCAQAHYTRYQDRLVGTFGDIGIFSLQESKHLQCGDGGLTITAHAALAEKIALFTDKGCTWSEGRSSRLRFAFPAPCYRMTELQGAVLLGQLPRLPEIVQKRQQLGEYLRQQLTGIEGIIPPAREEGGEHSYWFFPLLIEKETLGVTPDVFALAMAAEGVPLSGNWIGKPLYLHDALRQKVTFGESHFPFQSSYADHDPEYAPGLCPNAERTLACLRTIGFHERYSQEDMDDIARAIRKVATAYRHRRRGKRP
jgi:dTDP-4-amino-4,6-dideoxygalactose transaminase